MKASRLIAEAKKSAGETKAFKDNERFFKAKKFLLLSNRSVNELADYLDCSPKVAVETVKLLRVEGFNVTIRQDEVMLSCEMPQQPPLKIKSDTLYNGKFYQFGALGDSHLCSKWARLDVLNALYDIFEREGIAKVFHQGNLVEGECRFNKHELLVRAGFEPQMEYMANEYPQRKGIETWFLTGEDHEGWWTKREGINVGERMEQTARAKGRTDLIWMGHTERDVHLEAKKGHSWLRSMHPGGGSSYATTYSTQKLVESFQSGEKPHIFLVGHYHKFEQSYPREVHTVQTGATQDQSSFLRRMKIRVDVGGTIIQFHQADNGVINRFRCEWFPFYDKPFYSGKDKWATW